MHHYSGGNRNGGGGVGGGVGGGSGSLDTDPVFLLAFSGLGLYSGHDDFFLFLQSVMASLHEVDADRLI